MVSGVKWVCLRKEKQRDEYIGNEIGSKRRWSLLD
jgi:hypothetical protein